MLFIYLSFLLTPYLVLKPTHLAEVPYPFLLGPPASLGKSNLQLPLQ